jgi:hypothetical protein
MNKTRTKLTSVNVDRDNHQKFKIACISNGITFQKLVNIAIEMYLNDDNFKKIIDNK